MTEPTPDDAPTDDRLDRTLRAAVPIAAPQLEVRARHRAELDAAMARVRRPRSGVGLRRVAAVAVLAVLAGGIALAARDGDRAQVTAGQGDGGSRGAPSGSSGPALRSAACGGQALPFEVPLVDDFGAPAAGPVAGAPGPDVDGQLVAHWSNVDTALEVRWPADTSADVLRQLGQTRADMDAHLADGMSPSTYVGADLQLEVMRGPGEANDGVSTGSRVDPPLDGTYELAVTGYDLPATQLEAPEGPQAAWGAGLCATVQLTVVALDGRADVRDDAKVLYEALKAPGGPLVPEDATPALIAARTEATQLAPPSRCNLPPGVDQDPIRVEDLRGPGPFITPDEALAAYLDTRVATVEGPFGPEQHPTAPVGGYTAISLPDGRVAYRWPDPDGGLVGHFIAARGPGGWSITRTEGPSC